MSKKQKWVDEIILNLVALFNTRNKDGTKRNDDRTEKQISKGRNNPKTNKGEFKSKLSKEVSR